MNCFGLSIVVHAAKEWAQQDPACFARFFDISQTDKQWLVDAKDEEIDQVCKLPTSPIQVDFTTAKATRDQISKVVPTASIGTVTTILTAISDDLSSDLRVGMIVWGISDLQKATWMANSTVQDRLAMAMTGSVKFSMRCAFKKMSFEDADPTRQMATLMRILSGSRKTSN